MEPRRLRLDEAGLARLFGTLEARILEVLWERGPSTAREVHQALGRDRSYKTVLTVLNRLVEKGVLRRRRRERAYVYLPRESREELLARVTRSVTRGLVEDFGDLAVVHFVQALREASPEALKLLRQLLQEEEAEG